VPEEHVASLSAAEHLRADRLDGSGESSQLANGRGGTPGP